MPLVAGLNKRILYQCLVVSFHNWDVKRTGFKVASNNVAGQTRSIIESMMKLMTHVT